MNIEYVARNCSLDDRIREYAEDKLRKVLKFVEEPIEVRVTVESERHLRIAELHVSHRHGILQATEGTEQFLDSINQAVEKIEKQARRSRKKHQDRRRRAAARGGDNGHHWPMDVVERDSLRGEGSPRVVKSVRLPIKPMSIEEAALVLEDSKNEFVVFRDAESEKVSVLYKRRDDHYGLISPEP